jgi:hypothetical protein
MHLSTPSVKFSIDDISIREKNNVSESKDSE